MCLGISPWEIVERNGGRIRLYLGVEIITLLEVLFKDAEIEAVLLRRKTYKPADDFIWSWRCFCHIFGLSDRFVSIFDAFSLVFQDIFEQVDLALAILNIKEFLPHDIAVGTCIVSSGNSDEIVSILLPVR